MSQIESYSEYEALREFLSGIQSDGWSGETPPTIRPYELLVPHRFMPEQRRRLDDFIDILARRFSATMTDTLRGPFRIGVESFTEEYAERVKLEGRYFSIPLQQDNQPCGYIILPASTAIGWTTTLLGGMYEGLADEGRRLTSLESDLVLDMAEKVVQTFSVLSQDHGGPAVTRENRVLDGPLDLEVEGQIIEYCRLALRREESEVDLPFTLLLLSEVYEPIAGVPPGQELSPAEARSEILGHLNRVPMRMKALLEQTELAIRDVASLEEGDVLLTGKLVSEPLDVIVSGKKLYQAMPVQQNGLYALKILDVVEDV